LRCCQKIGVMLVKATARTQRSMDPLSITFETFCQTVGKKSFVTDQEKIYGPIVRIGKMAKLVGVYRAARATSRRRRPENETIFMIPNIWNLRKGDTDPCGSVPFVNFCSEITTWLGRKFPLNDDCTDMLWTDGDEKNLVMSVCNTGIDLC
jgi:hypothetical protein